MVSDSQLNTLALKAFTEIVEQEEVSKDERLTKIANQVAERIINAAEKMDAPGFQWKVRVLERDLANAFCLPGGKIVVFKGIAQYARNEAGLAAVIAHEVAHAVARHSGERLSQQIALRGAIGLGGEILRTKDGKLDQKSRLLLGVLGMGCMVGVVLPYSRIHEFEADRIGQIYMAAAGYDPEESLKLWNRMTKINKPPVPEWLCTHPATQDRIEKLKEFLPDAMKYYNDAPTKYGLGVRL